MRSTPVPHASPAGSTIRTQIALCYPSSQIPALLQGKKPISFRQAVGLGQIVQWDVEKVKHITAELALNIDDQTIAGRLRHARNWLERYNPDQLITLKELQNETYWCALSEERRAHLRTLRHFLLSDASYLIAFLETEVYRIPKIEGAPHEQNALLQRAFYKDVYNLLIGKDTGPRLSTFLRAVDRRRVLELLPL